MEKFKLIRFTTRGSCCVSVEECQKINEKQKGPVANVIKLFTDVITSLMA